MTFSPDESKGNTRKVVGVGKIQSDGNYTVEANGKPGLPEGWYKVTVQTNIPGEKAPEREAPAIYQTAEKTPLLVQVDTATKNYDLPLKKQ